MSGRGKSLRLTPKEFDLLHYLVNNANEVIPHRKLLQAVWGPEYGDEVEYLRVFVNQLRKKIETDPANPKFLLTEPWAGYRFALRRRAIPHQWLADFPDYGNGAVRSQRSHTEKQRNGEAILSVSPLLRFSV